MYPRRWDDEQRKGSFVQSLIRPGLLSVGKSTRRKAIGGTNRVPDAQRSFPARQLEGEARGKDKA